MDINIRKENRKLKLNNCIKYSTQIIKLGISLTRKRKGTYKI